MTTVTATYAKNNFGKLMDDVISKRIKVTVNRGNKPAVIISPVFNDYEFNLTDKEIDGIEAGMKEFRDSFKMNFDR